MKSSVFTVGCLLMALVVLVSCSPSPTAPTTTSQEKQSTAAALAPATSKDKIVFRALTSWPLNTANAEGMKHLAELVNQRGGGQLEIKIQGGPELIPVKEAIGAISKGVIDMFHDNNVNFPIAWAADYLPASIGVKVWEDKDFLSILDNFHRKKVNAVLLGGAANSFHFYLVTKKPVTKMEDLKGLRIRSTGGFSTIAVQTLGGSPATIATAEVYTALERGTVDGQFRGIAGLLDYKEYEVVNNVITQGLFAGNAMFLINQDVWNKLSPDAQKILKDAVADTHKWGATFCADTEKSSAKELVSKGMKFNTLSDDECARWTTQLRDAGKTWILKEAGDEVKPLLEIVKKYE